MKKYVLKSWWRYLLGMTFLVISTMLDIWFPLITMSIVDDVIVGGNYGLLKWNLICILIVGGGRAVAQYVKEFMCDMAGCNLAEEMRKDLMRHIQGLSKRYFDENNTGELMAHVKDDTGKLWDIMGFAGMLIVEASIYLVGVIICMIRLNYKLSLIPIAFLPLIGWLVMKLEKELDKIYGEISEENAVLTSVIEENISGVRTVKAFAREDYEIEKFDERNQNYNDLNIRQARYMAKMEPVIGIIPKIMQVCVLGLGGYWAITGEISYGLLVAFLQYAGNIVWPIENMGWLTNVLAASIASYKKIKVIFDAEPEITEASDAVSLSGLNKTLCFENVSFSLGDTQILKDINFTLEQGKTLGIMGATGAGKSTIVNLIERFYDVNDGAITIDGVDIRKIKINDVRDYSTVVTQDVFLFSDTINENIKLGQKSTMENHTVLNALAKAHALEFVDRLNGRGDAVIGERGIGLSGGQKQRLSIARALAKTANVLILDDSTSALDMETELEIQKELSKKKDMSKIIIAHRISSVREADEILVLDAGEIVERGNHQELMEKRGQYYTTYCTQYGCEE